MRYLSSAINKKARPIRRASCRFPFKHKDCTLYASDGMSWTAHHSSPTTVNCSRRHKPKTNGTLLFCPIIMLAAIVLFLFSYFFFPAFCSSLVMLHPNNATASASMRFAWRRLKIPVSFSLRWSYVIPTKINAAFAFCSAPIAVISDALR